MSLKPILCCPLVVISVKTVQTHLSGFICVRNSYPVGSVWNVIVRLILVDVLNKQRWNLLQLKLIVILCWLILMLTKSCTRREYSTRFHFPPIDAFVHVRGIQTNNLALRCSRSSPLILTALSDRDSVCKMSNMVFNTRPLQSRWGNLVKIKHMRNRIHTVFNMMGKGCRPTRFLDH